MSDSGTLVAKVAKRKPSVDRKTTHGKKPEKKRSSDEAVAAVKGEKLAVFDYLDYRAFLRDQYVARKARSGLSFRGFSRRAGLKSPNYLKLVMDGKRNLTDEMAQRFARALGLDADSSAYFAELVRFTQAKTNAKQNEAHERLTRFRRYREARPLDLAQAAYHSRWYLPALRELAARTDFKADASWIARKLVPTISASDAEFALETLLQLGLLVRDASGKVQQGEALVSTGPEVSRLHVVNYHRTMLELAAEAMDTIPPEERDISSLTMCLGPRGLRRLKERIRRFRRELLELSTLETNVAQVVQVNFQLFPLSRMDDGEMP